MASRAQHSYFQAMDVTTTTVIYVQDGNLVKIEDVVRPFLPRSVPMIDTPKVFLIDACRRD